MNRWTIILTVLWLIAICATACNKEQGAPVVPDEESGITECNINPGSTQTCLWGYYDIYLDALNETVESVANRNAMFTANVVNFVNAPVTNLGFAINGTLVDTGSIDVDIDVSITHPFPGMTQYNGYDVRGVFIGEGSATMVYNHDLVYPEYGTDQVMFDYNELDYDPHDGFIGMPDGYTRWCNAVEFPVKGLFGYTEGTLATPDYTSHLTSTLNPFKYFANGLGVEDDLWEFITSTDEHGVFISGTKNTRNYYLRFPSPDPNVRFGYSILANWEHVDVHPSNAPEAITCNVAVTDNIWYQDPSDNGGSLILDIEIFDWNSTVGSGGVMEDYTINIESNVLSDYYQFNSAEMTPIDGGVNYSTYHIEIPADNVTHNSNTADGEFWIITEDSNLDYTNDFGIGNLADTDPLAAFYRQSFFIASGPYNNPPDIISGVDGDETPYYMGLDQYSVTATDDDDDPLTYDWTVTDIASLTEVTTGINDNYDGTIDIDFAAVGASPDDEYLIECDVSDNINSPVPAIPLTVTASLADIVVVGDPNIDVLSGSGPPAEIAGDPDSDQIAIGYEWTTWRVFTDDYANYSSLHTISWWSQPFRHFDFLHDYGFRTGTSGGYHRHYNRVSWNSSWDYTTNLNGLGFFDVFNVQNTTHLWGLYQQNASYGTLYRCISNYQFDAYPNISDASWWNGTGTNGIIPANVIALDAPIYTSGYRMYFLEALPATNTAVVELWIISGSPTYGDISFGEDTLDNPLDITVDSNDYVYILDINTSSNPVIYAYDNTGAPIATSGAISSDDISGTAKRIDAAIYPDPDEVHVLHSDGVTKFTIEW